MKREVTDDTQQLVGRTLSDPKPQKRIKDPSVYDRFYEIWTACLHCGNRSFTAAHLLRGKYREDVLAGLLPLCGSGGSGCHGAFDSGHAYIRYDGRRVTPAQVKKTVAAFLRSEAGEAQAAYLIRKLGPFGAEAYVLKLEAAR